MFADEDFLKYLEELKDTYRKTIVIYTDLINQVFTTAVKSKLMALAQDKMVAYRMIQEEQNRLFK